MARGRPRSKPDPSPTDDNIESKQVSKRGRPKKETKSVHSDDSWSESMSRSPFKRSTKKQRKSITPSDNSEVPNQSQESSQSSNIQNSQESITVESPILPLPKKRGRPRKNPLTPHPQVMKKITKTIPMKKKQSRPSSSEPADGNSVMDDSEGSSTDRVGIKKEDTQTETDGETSQVSSSKNVGIMKKTMKKIKDVKKVMKKKGKRGMKSNTPHPMKKSSTQSNKIQRDGTKIRIKKVKGAKPVPMCSVPGCETFGHNFCIAPDEYGPIGLRCTAHNGGPRCVIPDCPSRGERKVTEPDYWSDTHFGTRCGRHGGGKRCSIPECNIPFQQMVKEKDKHGEPGYRCANHGGGYVCSVPGCKRISTGRAWGADGISKNSGRRCTEHMGSWGCNVPGCGRWSETDVIQPGDEWYKEDGLRCALHLKYKRILRVLGSKGTEAAEERRRLNALKGSNVNPKDVPQCNVPGCFTPSLNECTEPDLWGEGGHRCRRHGGGRRCNVPNCDGGAASKVLVEDKFGLPGFRCIWHGGGKRCVVENCDQPAGARFMHCKELHGDEIGPQGPRCCKHVCPNAVREKKPKKPKKKIKKVRIILKNLTPLDRVKEELKRQEERREANRERIRERDRQVEEDLRQAEVNSAARMRRSEMRWANKAMLFGCPHLKYKRRVMHRFMSAPL